MNMNDGVTATPGAAAAGAEPGVEDWVRHHARVQPDTGAVIGLRRTVTYRELDEAADRAATALTRHQVGPGSRGSELDSPGVRRG